MDMMGLTEIRRNPNVTDFGIKRNADGKWNVFFMIDKELHQVMTQRGQARVFKTLDYAVKFVEDCDKTNSVKVILK